MYLTENTQSIVTDIVNKYTLYYPLYFIILLTCWSFYGTLIITKKIDKQKEHTPFFFILQEINNYFLENLGLLMQKLVF